MRSKLQLVLIAKLSVNLGYGALPESEWLDEAIGTRFPTLEHISIDMPKLRHHFADQESVAKLKLLLRKIGDSSQAIDEMDIRAGDVAFQLLTAVKAPGIGDLALPILRDPQHPLHAAAAQAGAMAQDDRTIEFLEQALTDRLAIFSTPKSAMSPEILQQQQKAFDYLRCLMVLGTPKATSASERSASRVLAAAAVSGPTTRERFADSIEELKRLIPQARAAGEIPPAVTPAAVTPNPATPFAASPPPGSPVPTTSVTQPPAPTVERKTIGWVWAVGIIALIAIVAAVLKRRVH